MVIRQGQGADQFMLRLPPGMRDRIRVEAEANGRSMNAEVVATLAEAYPELGDPLTAILAQLKDLARQARDGTISLAKESDSGEIEAMPFVGGVPELLVRLTRLSEQAVGDVNPGQEQ